MAEIIWLPPKGGLAVRLPLTASRRRGYLGPTTTDCGGPFHSITICCGLAVDGVWFVGGVAERSPAAAGVVLPLFQMALLPGRRQSCH